MAARRTGAQVHTGARCTGFGSCAGCDGAQGAARAPGAQGAAGAARIRRCGITTVSRPADLDRVIHDRTRLAIMSALAANDALSFTELKARA